MLALCLGLGFCRVCVCQNLRPLGPRVSKPPSPWPTWGSLGCGLPVAVTILKRNVRWVIISANAYYMFFAYGRQGTGSMRSIRTKLTLLTLSAIVVVAAVVVLIGAVSTRNIVRKDADQTLYLLCDTGEKNLNQYFGSVQQSAATISSIVESDLEGLSEQQLQEHVDRMRSIFAEMAVRTQGIRTYYYRIDPTLSSKVKGFWYVNQGREGFQERTVTDISNYDVNDTSQLVWFSVPRATGKPVWLPPYITDNLDTLVISYDVPVYLNGTFVGVVGIEIDYETVARQVENITLYNTGYAYLTDENENIIFHPHVDVMEFEDGQTLKAPAELAQTDTYATYTHDGVRKRAAHLTLNNGMQLVVCAPLDEIDSGWRQVVLAISCATVALAVVFSLIAARFASRITKPLQELTAAAGQMNDGDYDIELNYESNDEVGVLARAFNRLIAHLRVYVGDLSTLAYADALTNVNNKGAFDVRMRELDERLAAGQEPLAFALGMFDCDGLKQVNDTYGHEKGDLYLQASCAMICRVFQHCPVFRVGGDEFAIILEGEDYANREVLAQLFEQECERSCEVADEAWGRLRISAGIVAYDSTVDGSAGDVLRRADELMYANKRERKARA